MTLGGPPEGGAGAHQDEEEGHAVEQVERVEKDPAGRYSQHTYVHVHMYVTQRHIYVHKKTTMKIVCKEAKQEVRQH